MSNDWMNALGRKRMKLNVLKKVWNNLGQLKQRLPQLCVKNVERGNLIRVFFRREMSELHATKIWRRCMPPWLLTSRLKASKFAIQGRSKTFQVCDKYLLILYCRKQETRFSFTNDKRKWHTKKILYICETTLIYTTFAFDSLFRVLAVFPKMKGFHMKAETIKVYWKRPDFALDDNVWQRHVVVLSASGGLWMRQHER